MSEEKKRDPIIDRFGTWVEKNGFNTVCVVLFALILASLFTGPPFVEKVKNTTPDTNIRQTAPQDSCEIYLESTDGTFLNKKDVDTLRFHK